MQGVGKGGRPGIKEKKIKESYRQMQMLMMHIEEGNYHEVVKTLEGRLSYQPDFDLEAEAINDLGLTPLA